MNSGNTAPDAVCASGPSIFCAHCSSAQPPDDWDVLDNNAIHTMACESCRRSFSFEVLECDACCHESATSWPSLPDPLLLPQETPCSSCGHTITRPSQDAHGLEPVDDFAG